MSLYLDIKRMASVSVRGWQASVIWVYSAEVFPSRVRSKGQSVGSSSHWIMNAIIAGIFPYIAAKSHAAPFVFFAVMMAVQFFVVLSLIDMGWPMQY